MTTFAELEVPTVAVTPGEEATTTLLVRNDSEIVEAYGFEVVGPCAPWTTVEPARLTLYPGTSEPVTVRLRPPRSPEVAAGELPLGVRVLPTERPETGVVSETTVVVAPFWELHAELAPRRRRAWRSARYRVALHNQGNTGIAVALAAAEVDERLRFRFPNKPTAVDRGTTAQAPVRVRIRSIIWFGKQVSYPFQLTATPGPATGTGPTAEPGAAPDTATQDTAAQGARPAPEPQLPPQELDGELVQLPVFPRWLLALLAAVLALLLAWFALVRPTVRSTAREAADDQTRKVAASAGLPIPPATGQPPAGTQPSGAQPSGGSGAGQPGGGAGGLPPGNGSAGGSSGQSSNTIEVRTGNGRRTVGTYTVPTGKLLRITDIVVANPQGDEGLITIVFGARTITVIALETFRNQDYHWVTPIDVPANATVRADVTCGRPGTPASGRQAANCLEVLNVNGDLVDAPR